MLVLFLILLYRPFYLANKAHKNSFSGNIISIQNMAKAKSKISFYNTERSCFISIRTSITEHLNLKSGDSIYKFSNSDSIYFIKRLDARKRNVVFYDFLYYDCEN